MYEIAVENLYRLLDDRQKAVVECAGDAGRAAGSFNQPACKP
ncbi:hypothetical protein BH24ACT22_BH24ACT22_11370 [soil metagenome]